MKVIAVMVSGLPDTDMKKAGNPPGLFHIRIQQTGLIKPATQHQPHTQHQQATPTEASSTG